MPARPLGVVELHDEVRDHPRFQGAQVPEVGLAAQARRVVLERCFLAALVGREHAYTIAVSTELEKLAAASRGKLVGKADASARQYSLRQDASGKMTCTCGDYKFRQGAVGGECKHIKAHRSSGARADGVPMIRDHVKAGSEAALAKYAIEFKSPKMQQVLQGAIDKAYSRVLAPPSPRTATVPGYPLRGWSLADRLRERRGIAETTAAWSAPGALRLMPPQYVDVKIPDAHRFQSAARERLSNKNLPVRRMLGDASADARRR